MMVLEGGGGAIDHQQPRIDSPRQRMLGNQVLGQLVVVIVRR